ncbi:hypothetical protein BN946_scf184830.g6 [Trametes cinnabarina]|uniref:AB hydrolase-1 domain-containing protein n=1 Tax=Pycnoporus cinnabarinus TaxID=5643 RepID=A0A060SFF2_PYCCI|nr:hypothetical protein BN946_scf184830.g6 [Trametes cinnabarina]
MDSNVRELEWPGMPEDVQSRILPVRDLVVHFFEAGDRTKPLIILLHGFPEIAYSWRKVILPLAHLGYHVVAPDQRGLGRTVPSDPTAPGALRPLTYEDDVAPYKTINLVHDVVALVSALGHRSVACLIGHDAGATIAGYAAVIRPDIFNKVVFISTPFSGPPSLPFDIAHSFPSSTPPAIFPATLVEEALATLNPPRKHYMVYYSTPEANEDVWHAPQGLQAFFRGYFHIKSADWAGNDPHPVEASATGLASIPHYYIMPRKATMADVAAADVPSPEEVSRNSWLPEAELAVYAREYGKTGFQGGLNRYRCFTSPSLSEELTLFAGKKIEMPAMYVSGQKDWGVYQNPGALEKMQTEACTRMGKEDVILLSGAGHWGQQEQPEGLLRCLVRFLAR